MMTVISFILPHGALVGLLLIARAGSAATFETDSVRTSKRAYSLFRPTPAALLRPLSTDRPDVTESAYSLDAGHFQVETELLRLGWQRTGPRNTRQELAINHANLKLGLSANTDVQLVVESFTRQSERSEQLRTHRSGFGDVTLRLKHNLWGNDGGPTALALMPFVKLPAGRAVGNGVVEGGVVAPFAWQLPSDWTLGSQLQASYARDAEARQHYLELAPTLTIGHDLYRTLGGFVEMAGVWDTRGRSWAATLNGGPTLRFGENVQADLGINLPLTHATPTTYFLGLSYRR